MNETRRRVLATAAAATTAGLAGCLGFGDGESESTTTTTTGTTTAGTETGTTAGTTDDGAAAETTTTTATDATDATDATTTTTAEGIDHPAAAGLADQPVLGEDDAPALVVAFEDPSCVICRRFESQTFPTLRDEYVADGSLRFAYRVFPVVYDWGKPAVQALEATYARSEDAFWALKAHYYDDQGAFDAGNVLSRTESFLAGNTDVDAAAVVDDAREEAYDAQVQADLAAGRDAGASATPTFFLFRDGEFRTRVVGAKDAAVFAAALEL